MTDGAVYNIKPKGTNYCLTYGSDKKLSLKQCSNADEGQKWANKGGAKNFQLIRGTNMCLNKNGTVNECKPTDAFKWNKTSNEQLKTKHDGSKSCIQKKGINAVEMAGCNNTNIQKWDMKAAVTAGPPPPSASPAGSPSPSSNSPGSPGSSPASSTSPSSATTPTPSPSSDDKKFWETTWFFWSAIGGGAFIVLSIIVCVIIIAVSSGSGGGGGHHPW